MDRAGWQKAVSRPSKYLSVSLWLGVPAGGINLYGSYVLYLPTVLHMLVRRPGTS
jgi:hypothetical protein